MRAVVVESTGPPERLVTAERPDPAPGEGQTLVDVRAAGVNFADVLIRAGRYPQPPELPWVPGSEIAGTTPSGERVLGIVRTTGGGYSERVAVDDGWLFALPERASFEEGAAFAMAFLTAWLPLTRQASVRPGRRVLVTAAAGGVGSAAVQVARLLGAEVVAAVGSDAKRELPSSLGAMSVVTYEEIGSLDRVDVVLDMVGGAVFTESIGLLRPLGTAIAVGFAGGAWEPLDTARLVGRNVAIAGFYLGRLMQLEPELVREALNDLLRLWNAGELEPVVGETFALDDASSAHRLIEERRSTGKVVLVP